MRGRGLIEKRLSSSGADGSGLQFGLQFTTVQRRPPRTD